MLTGVALVVQNTKKESRETKLAHSLKLQGPLRAFLHLCDCLWPQVLLPLGRVFADMHHRLLAQRLLARRLFAPVTEEEEAEAEESPWLVVVVQPVRPGRRTRQEEASGRDMRAGGNLGGGGLAPAAGNTAENFPY